MSSNNDILIQQRQERIATLKKNMQERIHILDGGMGTLIQSHQLEEADYRGERFADISQDVKGNNDLLVITQPEIIAGIHRQYYEAGADIVETNSFNSTRVSQADYDMEDLVPELNRAAAAVARQVADEVEAETGIPRYVAGVLGPTSKTCSISPDVNDPGYRAITFDQLVEEYIEATEGLMDGGADIIPEVRVIVGRMDERLISANRHNETNYLLTTFDRDYPGFGRLRVFDMVKRAQDNIPENLLQWAYQTPESEGQPLNITDPRLLEDAWHNSLWLNFDYTGVRGLRFINTVKWDVTHTELDSLDRAIRGQLQNEHFFGVINKASCEFDLGLLELEPRWKSEYRHQTRDHATVGERENLTQLFSVIGRYPILNNTHVEAGVEYIQLRDLRDDFNDLNSRVLAVQFTNTGDYVGYKLSTQFGVKFDRRDPENGPARVIQTSFISVFAGLE